MFNKSAFVNFSTVSCGYRRLSAKVTIVVADDGGMTTRTQIVRINVAKSNFMHSNICVVKESRLAFSKKNHLEKNA